jgi:hypothetical protein
MIHVQASKVALLAYGATVATNATTVNTIDTLGFDYAGIDVALPPASATNASATFSALKLTEGDTTVVSNSTSITGFTGGTDLTIPVGNDTTNPLIARFLVDLRPRKRYLFVQTTCPTGYNTPVVRSELVRPEQAPITDAKRGLNLTTFIG